MTIGPAGGYANAKEEEAQAKKKNVKLKRRIIMSPLIILEAVQNCTASNNSSLLNYIIVFFNLTSFFTHLPAKSYEL